MVQITGEPVATDLTKTELTKGGRWNVVKKLNRAAGEYLRDGEKVALAELSDDGLYVPATVRRDLSDDPDDVEIRFIDASDGQITGASFSTAYPVTYYGNHVVGIPEMVRKMEDIETGDTIYFAVRESEK